MNRLLAGIGIALTAAYLWVVWRLLAPRSAEILSLSANNLGDLLAGVFGPLAIVWLILGFFQQGIELRQNTQALRLQADELRNSVEQQRQLVEVTREQVTAEISALHEERLRQQRAAQPHFVFHGVGASFGQEAEYSSHLRNLGSTATEVIFSFQPPMKRCSHTVVFSWSRGDDQRVLWVYTTGLPEHAAELTISYVDSVGLPGEQKFRLVPDTSSPNVMVRIEPARV